MLKLVFLFLIWYTWIGKLMWTSMKTTSRSFRLGPKSTLKIQHHGAGVLSPTAFRALFWVKVGGNYCILWLERKYNMYQMHVSTIDKEENPTCIPPRFWADNESIQQFRTYQWENKLWILLAFKKGISGSTKRLKRIGIFIFGD